MHYPMYFMGPWQHGFHGLPWNNRRGPGFFENFGNPHFRSHGLPLRRPWCSMRARHHFGPRNCERDEEIGQIVREFFNPRCDQNRQSNFGCHGRGRHGFGGWEFGSFRGAGGHCGSCNMEGRQSEENGSSNAGRNNDAHWCRRFQHSHTAANVCEFDRHRGCCAGQGRSTEEEDKGITENPPDSKRRCKRRHCVGRRRGPGHNRRSRLPHCERDAQGCCTVCGAENLEQAHNLEVSDTQLDTDVEEITQEDRQEEVNHGEQNNANNSKKSRTEL